MHFRLLSTAVHARLASEKGPMQQASDNCLDDTVANALYALKVTLTQVENQFDARKWLEIDSMELGLQMSVSHCRNWIRGIRLIVLRGTSEYLKFGVRLVRKLAKYLMAMVAPMRWEACVTDAIFNHNLANEFVLGCENRSKIAEVTKALGAALTELSSASAMLELGINVEDHPDFKDDLVYAKAAWNDGQKAQLVTAGPPQYFNQVLI